jgi:imidazolonepropionase-like amidohydrolase
MAETSDYQSSISTFIVEDVKIIPGLIDAHIHALAGNTNSVEQSLRFGVTTVCDMHNEVEDIMRLKQVCLSFGWHSG